MGLGIKGSYICRHVKSILAIQTVECTDLQPIKSLNKCSGAILLSFGLRYIVILFRHSWTMLALSCGITVMNRATKNLITTDESGSSVSEHKGPIAASNQPITGECAEAGPRHVVFAHSKNSFRMPLVTQTIMFSQCTGKVAKWYCEFLPATRPACCCYYSTVDFKDPFKLPTIWRRWLNR